MFCMAVYTCSISILSQRSKLLQWLALQTLTVTPKAYVNRLMLALQTLTVTPKAYVNSRSQDKIQPILSKQIHALNPASGILPGNSIATSKSEHTL